MALAGKGGKVMWGAQQVGEVTEWSLDISVDMLEVTAMGDSWKEYIAGLRDWSGSLTVRFADNDAGQQAMRTALLGGTSASIELYVDADTKFSGTAFLSGGSPSVSVDGVVEMSFDFQGSGPLNYA